MKTNLFVAAVLMLFAAGAARAQQGDRPCRADEEKFCKDVKPGEGRIIACLKAHEAELSADCKANGMGAKSRGGARGQGAGRAMGPRGSEPCNAEMEKFCKDAKPGERMNCMKEHEKDFSEACKARSAAGRKGNMKQNPCAADMQKFCKDVKPGEGRLIACMKTHETELSDVCKARRTGGKGRGYAGDMPGNKPAPAGTAATSTEPVTK